MCIDKVVVKFVLLIITFENLAPKHLINLMHFKTWKNKHSIWMKRMELQTQFINYKIK